MLPVNEDILTAAAERAGLIWETRRKISSARGTWQTREFNRKLRASVERRDQQSDILKKATLSSLQENGFRIFCVNEANDIRLVFHNSFEGATWSRSSSRLGNFVEEQLNVHFVQTDIYDRYKQECKTRSLPFYPRRQVQLNDYRQLPLWKDARGNEFFFNYSLETKRNDFAMIGTNFITDEGQIVVMENTGNITYLFSAANVMLLASDEKIAGSLQDVFLWQSIYTQYGLRKWAAHTHIITTPAFTDTLPGIKTPYGSNNVSILWVEQKSIHDETGSCIECGLCMEVCPATELYGESFGWNGYSGAIGVLKSFLWEGIEGASRSNAWMCIDCGRCTQACPTGFDISGAVLKLRSSLRQVEGYAEQERLGGLLMDEYIQLTRESRFDYEAGK